MKKFPEEKIVVPEIRERHGTIICPWLVEASYEVTNEYYWLKDATQASLRVVWHLNENDYSHSFAILLRQVPILPITAT